jgi:undecaprenyl-diphosphatase
LIKKRKDALVFSFTLFFGIGLNLLLKDMFHRPRPHLMPLVHETSYSFPSGHAMNSFIFYTCLSFFVFRKLKNRQLGISLITVSGVLLLLIGISRIYLGAHYPSDVLAGYMAGLCWFVVVFLFEKTLIFLRFF